MDRRVTLPKVKAWLKMVQVFISKDIYIPQKNVADCYLRWPQSPLTGLADLFH